MLCICIMQFGHGWEDSSSTVGMTAPQDSTSCLKRPEMDLFQHVSNILTPLSSWARAKYHKEQNIALLRRNPHSCGTPPQIKST